MSSSGFPYRAAAGLDDELVKYLDRIGAPAAAVADIDLSATTATQNAKINEILSSLRAASKMDT